MGRDSPSTNSQSKPAAARISADAALASVTIVPSSVSPRLSRARNREPSSAPVDDLAAPHDDGHVQQVENELQRVTVDDRDIRDLAARPPHPAGTEPDKRRRACKHVGLIVGAIAPKSSDIPMRPPYSSHELDDVARREHDAV